MGLFEELSTRYQVEDVPPLGSCLIIPSNGLIIPSNEFKREWEVQLKQEGCKIFSQAHNGKVCFFVRPPAKQSQPAQQDGQGEAGNMQPKDAGVDLTEKIRQLRMQGLSYRAIAKELQVSPHTVYKKLQALGLSGPVKAPETKRERAATQIVCGSGSSSQKPNGLGELIESLRLLYQHGYRQACIILIENARRFLEG